jgi:hypothetical protein
VDVIAGTALGLLAAGIRPKALQLL